MNNWFEVDKAGLAKLLERRGKSWILYELLQNAWDEASTKVEVVLAPAAARRGVAELIVTDDSPEGFKSLSHAYTLFAESAKKGNPEKRGRFNLGEKLVLALCREAEIVSTTGGVRFNEDGTRNHLRLTRATGTQFRALVPMTREEIHQAVLDFQHLIQPPHVVTTIDALGRALTLEGRQQIATTTAALPTEIADEDGVLRPAQRTCRLDIYEPLGGRPGTLYEMGIPVVETGDRYDVNVSQKVPLNMDRDNVSPSYLRRVRVAVVNATAATIDSERAVTPEVLEATSHPNASPEAVQAMLRARYGERAFVADPSDPEAGNRLVAEGWTPVHGGSLTKGQWEHVRSKELVKPAGQISPSPKPYAEGGRPENVVPAHKWTAGMKRFVAWFQQVSPHLVGHSPQVKIVSEPAVYWVANYGPGGPLTMNLGRLGHAWFDRFPGNMEAVLDLIIHELGHEYCLNHLDEQYHKALTRLAAKTILLATAKPNLFSTTMEPERQ